MKVSDKNNSVAREMGAKLLNFRVKLAIALGKKKLTQEMFGEMFGGFSGRAVSSHESGEVEIPSRMFYAIWQAGGSVDGMFGYLEITEAQIENLKNHYVATLERRNQISILDRSTIERTLERMKDNDGKVAKKDEAGAGAAAQPRGKGNSTPTKISRRRPNV